MSRINIIKLIICSMVIIMLGFTDQLRSEPSGIMESIGKQDPFKSVEPVAELKKKLMQNAASSAQVSIMEDVPDLFLESIMLKFLTAANLETVVAGLTSGYGAVSIDEGTNTMIICDTRENLDRIVKEIRKADRTPRQILIEVVIVDVQIEDDTEIGVNWTDILSLDVDREDQFPTGSHSRSFVQNLISSSLTSGGGGTWRIIQDGIGVTIQALQATRDVEILASPRVLVVSGQQAFIQTIEEIPYTELTDTSEGSSGSVSAMTSTQFKEAGITLTVSAIITDEEKIMMVVSAEQSINTGTLGIGETTVPIVDKRIASTSLVMNDGQVVVMGGLRKKETVLTKNKVPLLGDLPIVGALFSNEKTDIKHTELLVFISPHIYKEQSLSEEQMARFNKANNMPSLKIKTKDK